MARRAWPQRRRVVRVRPVEGLQPVDDDLTRARALTNAASCSRRGTSAVTSTIRTWPAVTGSPVRPAGAAEAVVRLERDVDDGVGGERVEDGEQLVRVTRCRARREVPGPVDGAEAHGLAFTPCLVTIVCSTATSGSFVSTSAAANGDCCTEASRTPRRVRGPTATCFVTGFNAATAASPVGVPGRGRGVHGHGRADLVRVRIGDDDSTVECAVRRRRTAGAEERRRDSMRGRRHRHQSLRGDRVLAATCSPGCGLRYASATEGEHDHQQHGPPMRFHVAALPERRVRRHSTTGRRPQRNCTSSSP